MIYERIQNQYSTPNHYPILMNVTSKDAYVDFSIELANTGLTAKGSAFTNIQTLGLFCKRKLEGKIEKYSSAGLFFFRRAEERINISNMFLRKIKTGSPEYNTDLTQLLKSKPRSDALLIFSLPTHVYLDCQLPWEVWMLFYFSDVKFRDQLLLEEG